VAGWKDGGRPPLPFARSLRGGSAGVQRAGGTPEPGAGWGEVAGGGTGPQPWRGPEGFTPGYPSSETAVVLDR